MSEAFEQTDRKTNDQPTKLWLDEFAELRPWAQLGITARAIWRKLPSLQWIPHAGRDPLSAISDAESTVFLAILAVLMDRAIAEPYAHAINVLSLKSPDRPSGVVHPALLSLGTAAITSPPDPAKYLYELLEQACEESANECWGAVLWDLNRLSSVKPRDDAALRGVLVSPPLWPSEPPHWAQEGLSIWRELLPADEAAVAERYEHALYKEAPSRKEMEEVVLSWAVGKVAPTREELPPLYVDKSLQRPELRAISDNPWQEGDEDLLGYGDYADAIAGLITNKNTGTPLTLAINAPWGAGKTSLANMIKKRVADADGFDDRPQVVCWFNAWMHDDAPNLASAFAAEVAQAANKRRRPWRRLFNPLPAGLASVSDRHDRHMNQVLVLLVAALASLLLVPDLHRTLVDLVAGLMAGQSKEILDAVTPVTWMVAIGAIFKGVTYFVEKVLPVANSVASFVQNPEKTAAAGSMAKVRDQLGELIEQAIGKKGRFVVFVDDLERCVPPRSVDVLEVVNQLLNHENVVVVILADMPAVIACANIKYKDLAERYQPSGGLVISDTGPDAYGRAYIKKLIQLQFDLPPIQVRQKASGGGNQPTERWKNMFTSLATPTSTPATTEEVPQQVSGWRRFLSPSSWGDPVVVNDAWKWLLKSWNETKQQAWSDRISNRAGMLLVFPAVLVNHAVDRLVYGSRAGIVSRPEQSPWEMRTVLALGTAIGFVTFILLVAAIAAAFQLKFSIFFGLVGLYATTLTVCAVGWWALRSYQFRQDQEYTKDRERTIRELATSKRKDGAPLSETDAEAIAKEAHVTPEEAKFVEQIIRHEMFNDERTLGFAYEEMLPFLPPLPRSAKRLTNRLRLLLYIAQSQGMLADNGETTARQIGKWVALGERWPELARALGCQPEQFGELETYVSRKDIADYHHVLRATLADEETYRRYSTDDDLKEALASSTRIGDSLDRLMRLVRT